MTHNKQILTSEKAAPVFQKAATRQKGNDVYWRCSKKVNLEIVSEGYYLCQSIYKSTKIKYDVHHLQHIFEKVYYLYRIILDHIFQSRKRSCCNSNTVLPVQSDILQYEYYLFRSLKHFLKNKQFNFYLILFRGLTSSLLRL